MHMLNVLYKIKRQDNLLRKLQIFFLLQLLFSRGKKSFVLLVNEFMGTDDDVWFLSYSVRIQKQPVTLFLQDFGGALLQDGQVRQDCHHLGVQRENFYTKFWMENADFLHRVTSPSLDLRTSPPTVSPCS